MLIHEKTCDPYIRKLKFLTVAVIFLPVQPTSFTHTFVSEMQSFYFSESQDAMVLQTCHGIADSSEK